MTPKEMWQWHERYENQVERSNDYYDYVNSIQPVHIRELTDKEKAEIFGGNPNYIKNIGRNDGHEWRLLNDNN